MFTFQNWNFGVRHTPISRRFFPALCLYTCTSFHNYGWNQNGIWFNFLAAIDCVLELFVLQELEDDTQQYGDDVVVLEEQRNSREEETEDADVSV